MAHRRPLDEGLESLFQHLSQLHIDAARFHRKRGLRRTGCDFRLHPAESRRLKLQAVQKVRAVARARHQETDVAAA